MKTRNFSKKREAILAKIRSTTCHPSAEWVYQELKDEHPKLSLGTVYRNIGMFKDEGTVISVGTIDGQERFDGDIAPHGHFVCKVCRAVLDFPLPPLLLETAGRLDATGAAVDRVELTTYGTCTTCLEA